MPEENPNTVDINNYANTPPTTPPVNINPVNPTAPAPQPAAATPPVLSSQLSAVSSPKNTFRKVLLSLAGVLGFLFIAAFALIIISSPNSESTIAKLLGLSDFDFISALTLYIHSVMAIGALFLLINAVIHLIRASRIKIEEKELKKIQSKKALKWSAALIGFMIIWLAAFLYLDSKRPIDPDSIPQVITDPVDTLNLSAPIEVIFNASEFTFDQDQYQIVSHNWNFGDTQTATGQIVAHRYNEKGTYEVTLEIMLRNKKTGTLESGGIYNLVVSVTNESLGAKFTADPQSGPAPLEVTFDASESLDPDGFIESYEWDLDSDGKFDDGEGVELKHTFEKIGKYRVGLRVTSSTGEYNVTEKEINVTKEDLPTAEISIVNEPNTLLVGTSYTFQAKEESSPNGQVNKFVWDFGDSSRSQSGRTASKSFKDPGTYQVTLTLTDETGQEGSVKRLITVGTLGSAPRPVIDSDPGLQVNETALSGTAPFSVNFSAENSLDSDNDITEYAWDLDGDKTMDQYGENIDYTFRNPGNYTVTLQVTDADGNRATSTLNVNVKAIGLTAKLTASPNEGSVPLTVNFDASGSSYAGGQITSYRWDFGDNTGEQLSGAQISHKYTAIGTYPAKVTAIAADGTQNTITVNITVRQTPLAACFDSVFESGPAPLTTAFDASCSTGTISSYFWNFGDGGTSTQPKPNYTFETPGNYTVTLEISDSGDNISKFEKGIEVGE